MTDLRYAIRTLGRTPGFALVVILTLALGIGVNTAIFSVIYAVLLRPLPFADPGELVALRESLPPGRSAPERRDMPLAPPTTRDWAGAPALSSLAYYARDEYILTGGGEPARVAGAEVSWTFFQTLGVSPALGRPITEADDRAGAPLVCIISHDLWRGRFGGDPDILNRPLDLSGRLHLVIGIAPPRFAWPEGSEIWTPLAIPESEFADDQRLSFYLGAVGRLKRGATVDQASAELNLIASRLAARFPDRYEGRGATVVPLHEAAVREVRPALLLLFGIAGCVLLIACVNVANLLLARGATRSAELATRAALGASRARILRQFLTEGLLLALAGAAAGVLLAMWARDAIVAISPPSVPRIGDMRINLPVLAFAFGLAGFTALLVGMAPAVAAARRALAASVAGGRKGTAGGGRQRLRGALVVAQLALSLALLTGAGLLAKTLWTLLSVDPGFNPSAVMTMELLVPREKYQEPERRVAFFTAVVDTLARHPLVIAAGGSTNLPLSNTNMSFGFYREGMDLERDAPHVANVRGITDGYFRALEIPLLRGRGFSAADRPGSPPVVIVNDAMRRTFWPGQDPIGQRISLTRGRTTVWREIVGVVGDIRHRSLGAGPEPEIYMPFAHDPFAFMRIAVRSPAPPDVVAGVMRAAVWSADPAQPVSRMRPMDAVIAASLDTERFNAVLIGTFAVLALVLAAIGLYGVIAYSVTLRLHEFGVRLALGADRRHLVGLVLRQALRLACAGLVAGLGLALAVTRTFEAQLSGTLPADPMTFAAVAAVLVAIALAASYVPVRRAVRVDPMTALRAE